MPEPVRPPALRPGDAVMLVSPSGPAPKDRLEIGITMLESWGLRPVLAPGALERQAYLAGPDDIRLTDFNAALRDPDIRGVICIRGGYGAQRIVDGLDMAAARANPKVLAGFSDITALQMALWAHAGVASVQGPMAAWNVERTGETSAASLRAALMSTDDVVLSVRPEEETAAARAGGTASGILLGGNLCLIASTVGTPGMPDFTGAILLLEDIDEPPYKVDRMLTQLRRSGALEGIAGVAIGQFTNCVDGWNIPIAEVLMDRLGDLGVPIVGGLPTGHGPEPLSVPVGVPAVLDANNGTLTVVAAVS